MPPFRVIAISTELAAAVRATGRSPGYGHPVHRETASGYGPCRHCLRTFRIGAEERMLFTHDPFAGLEPLPLPGPVFIHAEPCDRYPEESGFPVDLLEHPLTLNAYGTGRRLVGVRYAEGSAVEGALTEMLSLPGARYVHVRDTAAGCFDLRVEPDI